MIDFWWVRDSIVELLVPIVCTFDFFLFPVKLVLQVSVPVIVIGEDHSWLQEACLSTAAIPVCILV